MELELSGIESVELSNVQQDEEKAEKSSMSL